MRHVNYTLKPAAINSASPRDKAYSLTDGGGLHIEVLPSGSKVWRYKYHLDGKREKVTIGAYPAFSIKAARDRHEELRALVERNESPAKQKQIDGAERRSAEARAVTFKTFAEQWIDETLFYRSAGYRAQIIRWLQTYVYPVIGELALGDVQPGHVLSIIEKRLDTTVAAERRPCARCAADRAHRPDQRERPELHHSPGKAA